MNRLMLMLLFACLGPFAQAQLAYPQLDELEADPFTPPGLWSGSGNCAWSTDQAVSGIYSLRLYNLTGGWTGDANKALVGVSSVPQAGIVKFSWRAYFTQLTSGNKLYHMMFGSNGFNGIGGNGIGQVLVVGFDGTAMQNCDGAGNWGATGYTAPLNQWVQFSVLFDQDNRTYDLLADDVVILDDRPFIAGAGKLGDASNGVISSFASWGNSDYYIDDVILGPESFLPAELTSFEAE